MHEREITMADVEAIIGNICAGLFEANPATRGAYSTIATAKDAIRYCLFNDHGRALFARAVVLARTGDLTGGYDDSVHIAGEAAIIEQAEQDALERCGGDLGIDEIRPSEREVGVIAAQEASTGEDTDRIRVTHDRPAGYGPYLWAIMWQMEKAGAGPGVGDGWTRVSVFTDYTDMQRFEERITKNGHVVIGHDLAVDQGRRCIDPDVQMNG